MHLSRLSGLLLLLAAVGSEGFAREYELVIISEHASVSVAPVPDIVTSNANEIRWICAADMDGDGDNDLVGALYYDNEIAWWENSGNSCTNWGRTSITKECGNVSYLQVIDWESDGDMDVVSGSYYGDGISWWESLDESGTNWVRHIVDGNFDFRGSIEAVDMDGDGDRDILSVEFDGSEVVWWENRGGNGQLWAEWNIDVGTNSVHDVGSADLDGDGDADIFGAVRNYNATLRWWENIDGSALSWISHEVLTNYYGATLVERGDIDEDGDIDLVGLVDYGRKLLWCENSDGMGLSWANHLISGSSESIDFISVADVDGDGDDDVLTSDIWKDEIAWRENCGSYTQWVKRVLSERFDQPYCVQAAVLETNRSVVVVGAAARADEIAIWTNPSQDIVVFEPPADTNYLSQGLRLSAYLNSEAVVDGTTRWVFTEWERTGCDPELGFDSATTPFVLTNDAAIVFDWKQQFRLEVTTNGPGFVNVSDDWVDIFAEVCLTARAEKVGYFLEWTGCVGGAVTNNPLCVTMDQSLSITGNFDWRRFSMTITNELSPTIIAEPAWEFIRNDIENIAYILGVVDIDLDGDSDIVGASHENELVWMENTTGDGLSWSTHTIVSGEDWNEMQLGDLDCDGDADIVVSYGAGALVCWENQVRDRGGFCYHHVTSIPELCAWGLADVNGDGFVDILGLTTWQYWESVRWWKNENTEFTNWTENVVAQGYCYGSPIVKFIGADIDGDGNIDVLMLEEGYYSYSYPDTIVACWMNMDGEGLTWTNCETLPFDYGDRYIGTSDMNGDGVDNIVTRDTNIAWWELSAGSNDVWTRHDVPEHSGASDLILSDFDRDGDTDIVSFGEDWSAYNRNIWLYWYRNDCGTGVEWTFTPLALLANGSEYGGGPSVMIVDVNDLDGDGSLDVVGNWAESYYDRHGCWFANGFNIVGIMSAPMGSRIIRANETMLIFPYYRTVGNAFTQWVCQGWSQCTSNGCYDQGTIPAVLRFTNDIVMSFDWDQQFKLATEAWGTGDVVPSSGWIPAAEVIDLEATAMPYHSFDHWEGDIPPGLSETSSFSLTATGSLCIVALFDENMADQGVPEWWLAEQGWTSNFNTVVWDDPDGDSFATWEEFIAGTVATNSASFLSAVRIEEGEPVRVYFEASTNRLYTLQYSEKLDIGTWYEVSGQQKILFPSGGERSLADPETVAGRTYRIAVELP